MRGLHGADQRNARGIDGVRIGGRHLERDFAFQRRRQHLRREGVVVVGVDENFADGFQINWIGFRRCAGLRVARHLQQQFGGERLARFPTIEGVGVVAHQFGARAAVHGCLEMRGRGEAAAHGEQRRFGDIDEGEGLLRAGEFEHALFGAGGVLAFECQRQGTAALPDEAETHRNVHRLFLRLAGSRIERLLQGQRISFLRGVVMAVGFDGGRAGLAIPEAELRKIAARGIFEALHPIFDGCGFAVMALEIKIGRLAIAFVAHQRFEHADDLGALLIDRCGVEIVDLDIALWLHGMRERACVFHELPHAQHLHVFDALHGTRAFVGGEILVAENGEAFLQGQLEPVAAGDAVAGPVVEILMRHNAFDAAIIVVCRGLGGGEQELVVEDVEALVLHRAHVEGRDGDDHEDVQIVFAAISLFVPTHRALERIHGIGHVWLVAMLDIDRERDLAPGHGDEFVAQHAQIARDQREEIAGLLERIVPHREVAAAGKLAAVDQIPVGQQHRIFLFVGFDACRVDRQIVGTVEEIGDAAEAFGFALRAEDVARFVETGERSVRRRGKFRDDVERETLRHVGDREGRVVFLVIGGRERLSVHCYRHQRQMLAVQDQRRLRGALPDHFADRGDARLLHVEIEGESDLLDAVVVRAVVLEMNGVRFFGAHRFSCVLGSGIARISGWRRPPDTQPLKSLRNFVRFHSSL